MHVIEHSIRIPAPPQVIWQLIGDLSRIPEWQPRWRSVSLLSAPAEVNGPGTRIRLSGKRGRDYILEIRAWYDQLGYEYSFVDGPKVTSNRGQVRVHETPDGTVVQWTFQYEPGGLLGRGGFGPRREVESEIIEGLRALYTVMEHRKRDQPFEARSLMRDAPDVHERSRYKPRHPSVFERETPPPTRPVPQPDTAAFQPTHEGDVEDDTRPHVDTQTDSVQTAPALPFPEEKHSDPTSINDTENTTAAPLEYTDEPGQVSTSAAPTEATAPGPPMETEHPSSADTDGDSEDDTSRLSVFDLFGVPKPSETQEMALVVVPQDNETIDNAAAEAENVDTPSPASIQTDTTQDTLRYQRVGLRRRQRDMRVDLRLPE